MSFILDALKKSQDNRQQQMGPATISVEAAPRHAPAHNWWIVVTAVVVVNLVVLAGFMYWLSRDSARDDTSARSAQASPGARPSLAGDAGMTVPQVPPPTTSRRREVRPLAAEVMSPEPTPPAQQSAAGAASPVNNAGPVDVAPGIVDTAPAQQGFLPTLAELALDNRIQLSPLHVDVHVYNENPQRRFVLVNTRKYKEGERLSEGPLLEEIRRDGMVLYYRGQRFLVPRE